MGKGDSMCKSLEIGYSSHMKHYPWSFWCQNEDNDGVKVIKAMATFPEHLYAKHCTNYLTLSYH